MYGETFKSALYGAFQPADEECDPSFLVRLLEYFPTDKVDVGSGICIINIRTMPLSM